MSKVLPIAASTAPCSPQGRFPILFERYQVLGYIGQGGMGTVYKGYHLNLKRSVAIKVIRIDRINRSELVNRFLREMQAVGQMDHPNVVRATDAGEKNGVCYLVMEYLTGSNLAHLVTARGRLEAADACELARQAALGLEYVHQSLVHRDIKPSNLMLTRSGLVKILDLGLARLHETAADDPERTPEGCVLGTGDYLAPEQAEGCTQIDVRADIYSLGCTLFQLLTGRVPFGAPQFDTLAKKLFAHCHVSLTAIEQFELVPEALRPVLLRMTAKDPGERYAAAREVAQALVPFAVASQPVQLLEGAKGSEPTVQHLPEPLPEELKRLMAISSETQASTSASVNPKPPVPPFVWRRVLGAGILAALAGLFVLLLLHLPGVGQPDTLALRGLDELGTGTHRLLDQMPFPIGCEGVDHRIWDWDKEELLLKVNGPYDLLIPLGTTLRSRFTLEVGITQAPWDGNVGVFWGYHEDAEARKARVPNREFAGFQMVCLWRQIGDKGVSKYYMRRGKGHLTYDESGAVQINPHFSYDHPVPPLDLRETILLITVEQSRLIRAALGQIELTSLCSEPTNQLFAGEPYQGSIGLVTLGRHATFGNVRFIAHWQH